MKESASQRNKKRVPVQAPRNVVQNNSLISGAHLLPEMGREREGERERGRERERVRQGGREGEREREREGGREGERDLTSSHLLLIFQIVVFLEGFAVCRVECLYVCV